MYIFLAPWIFAILGWNDFDYIFPKTERKFVILTLVSYKHLKIAITKVKTSN
jgi:hypothetical protein